MFVFPFSSGLEMFEMGKGEKRHIVTDNKASAKTSLFGKKRITRAGNFEGYAVPRLLLIQGIKLHIVTGSLRRTGEIIGGSLNLNFLYLSHILAVSG